MVGADDAELAWDGDRLVGFATAVTDGALFANASTASMGSI